jgi:2-haloacid dehalogenase
MPARAVIFDAYGTLFDVYALASTAERFYPGAGTALAQLWRTKQIEYTQLRTMCSMYKPFWEVTQDALIFTCKKLQLDLTLDAQNALMGHMRGLMRFPKILRYYSSCVPAE